MTDDAYTLRAFFGLDDPKREQDAAKALQNSAELRGVRGLPGALRAPAANAIVMTAKALLSDPVSGLICNAWTKAAELQRFIKAPPDQINEFTLHEHEVALSRAPSVDLVVNGAPTGVQLRFELKVALSIASASLRIQNAHIVGATLGKVRGGGSFSLGRATLVERKTELVRLPAELTFNPGARLS
ncbi:MAG: hypothetical protein AB7O98_02075 [Hyphomonadaceae bacterium]